MTKMIINNDEVDVIGYMVSITNNIKHYNVFYIIDDYIKEVVYNCDDINVDNITFIMRFDSIGYAYAVIESRKMICEMIYEHKDCVLLRWVNFACQIISREHIYKYDYTNVNMKMIEKM